MWLFIPPVGVVPKHSNFLDRCFLGCLPPLTGVLLGVGLEVSLLSGLDVTSYCHHWSVYIGVPGGLFSSHHSISLLSLLARSKGKTLQLYSWWNINITLLRSGLQYIPIHEIQYNLVPCQVFFMAIFITINSMAYNGSHIAL